MGRISFGIGIEPTDSLRRTVEIAKMVETLGYGFLGICDERLGGQRDAYVTLAACALNTNGIVIGPHISDPYSRHPVMLAQAIASLDELAPGRTIIPLGAGGSGFSQIGFERTKPAQTLKEAVQIIRALLTDGKCHFEGRVFKVRHATLGLEAHRLPIYVSSRSPKVLQAAGEVADGVVIGTYAAREAIEYALANVADGARKGGRDLNSIEIVSWVYMSISDDSQTAMNSVRPFVASAIYRTSPEAYPHIGITTELAERVRKVFDRGDDLYGDASLEAGRLLTDDVVRKFSIAGDAEDCVEHIRQIEKVGIRKIWIMPFSFPGAHYIRPESYDVLRPFAENVMNGFK